MSNIISFSLWGNNPKYMFGAIKNVKLAKDIYPEFKCRFYIDNIVPFSIINVLEEEGAEIVEMNCVGNNLGMYWRMDAINEADIVLIRDCDSRLNMRERQCVNEWINGDRLFHTILDHPYHRFCVMPGIMSFKRSTIDMDDQE